MYRGYNLDLTAAFFSEADFITGDGINNKNRSYIRKTLDGFISPAGTVDGSKLQEYWFPSLKADVFISHSHKDIKLAVALSGWLSDMGVSSFIDSTVWGYAPELQKLIDNAYCQNDDKKSYNYNLRNLSTAHVHTMLSTALSMVIDRTECVFFLNTSNSISSQAVISKTTSPWLYHELAMTRLVEKRLPQQHRAKLEKGFSAINEGVAIEYEVKLGHLTEISAIDLLTWQLEYSNEKYALDLLYGISKIKGKKTRQ
jgi:hypothetical protein